MAGFQIEDLLIELKESVGSAYTNRVVSRLYQFAYIPNEIIESLAREALNEEWGLEYHALKRYLAIHIAWSIEQGKVTCSDNQWFVAAGHLQTRYGTPIYLAFERNRNRNPIWYLKTCGSMLRAPEFPDRPEIPQGEQLNKGVEIVMAHDHILGENASRVPFLQTTPPVAQMCAISGAIQWSLNRSLEIPYWYYGRMQYLVPLYLQSRENIVAKPDLVATIQVNRSNLLVRTVLNPEMPYPIARVAVERHDELPAWMIYSWHSVVNTMTEHDVDNLSDVQES